MTNKEFIWALPKAELHLHLEGTLEPEMMMQMAIRNKVAINYSSIDAIREAYIFKDLQSFLDILYAGCSVLITEQDFYDLTMAYLERAKSQGVYHVEVFFDPQTHTHRGIAFETVITGIHKALSDGEAKFGITSFLILSFLRHLSQQDANQVLQDALPFLEWISAVGLDSSEIGNPPSKFEQVFAKARSKGLKVVAHAGEEGPPDYIWQALDILCAKRIDHGVRALEDDKLIARLVHDKIALTVCPISNVKLKVFPSVAESNLVQLLDRGIRVTINSDDPAYFGGYISDNLLAVAQELNLERHKIIQLVRNSFLGSFLPESEKKKYLDQITIVANA